MKRAEIVLTPTERDLIEALRKLGELDRAHIIRLTREWVDLVAGKQRKR